MTIFELETEIEVLNESLLEAEELTDAYAKEIERLRYRISLLENHLHRYGISFDDIDVLTDVE